MGKKRESIKTRFWKYVSPERDVDTCWIWQGSLSNGYGQIAADMYHLTKTAPLFAHRVAWELAYGTTIPNGMEIDHICRVKACVNPSHLELVTHEENMKRFHEHPWRTAPKSKSLIEQPEVRVYRLNPDGTKGERIR